MALLHSRILGEGKPFIIVHGFLGMSDNWKTLGKKFAEIGYQVHLVDQRNHGKSFHDSAFNYDLMCNDLLYYMQHYQLKESILLGHSMGGKTVMEFSCKQPDMVSKLIVADIAPKFYPEHHQTILAGLEAIDFSVVNSRKEADETLAKYISQIAIRQFLLKNLYWKEKGVLDYRFNLKALINNIKEVGKALDPDASCPTPTLFVKGAQSNYILDSDHRAIYNQFPNATIVSIPKAGHWLHAEDPETFFDAVTSFIY